MRSVPSMGVFLAGLALVAAPGCTGGGGGGGGEKIDHLVVAPDGATIDASTSLTLRATGVTAAGRVIELEEVEWSADAGTVTAGGTLTPSGVGTVTVTAESHGRDASATVTVIAPGTLSVRLVDATTGAAVAGGTVALVTSASTAALSGGDGTAQLTGGFSGALDLGVTAPGYVPMTIYGLKTRDVRVPLRPEEPPPGGAFSGIIDFTEAYDADSPPAGYLWVGIAGPAIKGNILAYGFDSLLGPNRTVSIGSLEIDAPSNLYIQGITEPFVATAPAGETVAFALGGEISISKILDVVGGGVEDLGDAIAELLPTFNTFHYATREGVDVAGNQVLSGQDLVLDTKLSKKATLKVPARPVNDPNPLVIAAVDFGPAIGFVPAGINIVDGAAATSSEVRVPPLAGAFEDRSYVFLVVSQEGGLGTSGGDQQVGVLTRGVTRLSEVELPSFLAPPSYASFVGVGATRTFSFDATDGADFSFHTFSRPMVVGTSYAGTLEWDVVAAGDADGFVLPMIAATNAAQAGGNWTVQTLRLGSQTYESLFTPGAPIDSTSYFNDANRVVITNADVD